MNSKPSDFFLTLLKLCAVGFIAGVILMLPLKLMWILRENPAYHLLFNFDYVPLLNDLRPVWFFGYVFHFVTCICSVVCLYYLLRLKGWEYRIWAYVLVYTLGGGALFFLTALSPQPPLASDREAWLYWTLAHALFGLAVGVLIRWGIKRRA